MNEIGRARADIRKYEKQRMSTVSTSEYKKSISPQLLEALVAEVFENDSHSSWNTTIYGASKSAIKIVVAESLWIVECCQYGLCTKPELKRLKLPMFYTKIKQLKKLLTKWKGVEDDLIMLTNNVASLQQQLSKSKEHQQHLNNRLGILEAKVKFLQEGSTTSIVVDLLKAGKSVREVAAITNLSKSVVGRIRADCPKMGHE
jgi:hypothetical protein